MYASIIALVCLGFALAWTALNKSGIPAFDWYVSLVLIGLSLIGFWLRPRRLLCPPLPAWLNWTICGLLVYLVFQVIPLPLPLLNLLSPTRAELTRSLFPVTGPITAAPISVDPAAHILWSLTIAGCVAVFFLVRDLTFRFQNRLFFAALPLFLVAGFEAILGLIQIAGGAEQAVGSYNSRDHYCCILELTLPLTIGFGFLFFNRRHDGPSIWPVVQAVACWLTSGLLTLGILFSLSRAGWIDSIAALLVLAILILFPGVHSMRWRIGLFGGIVLAVVALFVFASPAAMLVRLTSATTTESEGRLYIWKELVPLLRNFRWFGTGLMGFDPVFLKYQAFINTRRIDFAHNDFLQYLIELGLLGFVPLMLSLAAIVWPVVRDSWPSASFRPGLSSENRLLLAACVASFTALWIHSLVDFNLYIPANIFTFAWILGFASALTASRAPKSDNASKNTNQHSVLSQP